MEKRVLQAYSTWAKENLETQVEVSLRSLGINGENDIKDAKRMGDVTVIDGDPTSYPADLCEKRTKIVKRVRENGYQNEIEEFAYTWFNRLVALRFMEVHGFLSHGFRVLSNPSGGIEPEILKNLGLVAGELKLDMGLCTQLKQQGKVEELFRHVLIRQCNALSGILPMLFRQDEDYLEILLPNTLLRGETVVTRLVEIPEEFFLEDVEIIGWMYQFYISSKKDAVYASKRPITKDTLPAVTQHFTPEWIVRYMAENSVGRLWLESYPNSQLRSEMRYYVEDAEQTQEVQEKMEQIKYRNVKPEEIRVLEPCCGSGHILVYVFDLLYKMYEERGYQKRDIPTLILRNNLVGLDVDKRAAQLASFALAMKARRLNNRFFQEEYYEEPHVYELKDSKMLIGMGYQSKIRDLEFLNDDERELIEYIVNTFENCKTIGSLLKVDPIDFACLDGALDKMGNENGTIFNTDFMNDGVARLRELSNLAKVLSAKYDVMITNPPYIGTSAMEAPVKEYASLHYPNSKADMFAMFMETNFVKPNGFLAMINMHSWMFLSTYEKLRSSVLASKSIIAMAHLGARAFEEIGGEVVQTTSFVMLENHVENYLGIYCRLVDPTSQDGKEQMFLSGENRYTANQANFAKIPGSPVAYWVSENFLKIYNGTKLFGDIADIRAGVMSGDDERFIRFWHEVEFNKFDDTCNDVQDSISHRTKWFPITRGGNYRKWYGNISSVINLYNGGYEIKHENEKNHRLRDSHYYFLEGITWTMITSYKLSVRYVPKGILFGNGGPTCFFRQNPIFYLSILNSKVAEHIIEAVNPTLNTVISDICGIPIRGDDKIEKIEYIAQNCISLSRTDWDSFETSWDFQRHPLVRGLPTIAASFAAWQAECEERFQTLKANEEELNRIFIDIYGLQDELTPEEEDKDVTVRLADKGRDIRSLISYLVGIVMGRYSLDVDGLAYAGGDWDPAKYVTYQPDDDGIVPIYTVIGMEDGLTTKVFELIRLIYGEDTYRENIDYIADALGKSSSESSEETLNRYLNDGFYADHLKVYQKRPIYWLFTSGRNAGFKCLIYMHRYNEDTLARINAKYFLPESTRKKNELEEMDGRIAQAKGRDRIRLERERQSLALAYHEAIEYGQVLDHMANKYVQIDLDDGVKANYGKFQGVEIVTDSGGKVKRDLLAPLK